MNSARQGASDSEELSYDDLFTDLKYVAIQAAPEWTWECTDDLRKAYVENLMLKNNEQIKNLQQQQANIIKEIHVLASANYNWLQSPLVEKKSRTLLPQTVRTDFIWKFNQDPCPSLEERKVLSQCSGLSRKQVDTWFCNRRKRIKKKMNA